jgi:hypothetical protein
VVCSDYRRILGCRNIWTNSLDIDETFGNDYAGNANALLEMIYGYAVKIQSPTPADITAQREAATMSDERACFVDSATDGGHMAAPNGETDANPPGIKIAKAAYRL